jgi:putative drug exporter of the RND superfamily
MLLAVGSVVPRILGVFGLGLAVAVLVDATVVRMVLVPAVMQLLVPAVMQLLVPAVMQLLVPAVMQLLGPANWLPRWIGRAIPNMDIEPDVDQRADTGLVPTRPVSLRRR